MARTGMNGCPTNVRALVLLLLAVVTLSLVVSCADHSVTQPQLLVNPDLPVTIRPLKTVSAPEPPAEANPASVAPPPAVVMTRQSTDAAAAQASQTQDKAPPPSTNENASPELVQASHTEDKPAAPPATAVSLPVTVTLSAPVLSRFDRPLPINLATALQLTNANAWDIAIAGQRVSAAAAEFDQKAVLWVPTLYNGVSYSHHDGPFQNADGSITDTSRSALYAGTAPFAVFQITDAIFEPLAANQVREARDADLQTVTNDTLLAVAQAYFDVEEARADLAGIQDVLRRMREVVRAVKGLAPELVPHVEVSAPRHRSAGSSRPSRPCANAGAWPVPSSPASCG